MRSVKYILLLLCVSVLSLLGLSDREAVADVVVNASDVSAEVKVVSHSYDTEAIQYAREANSLFQAPRIMDSTPSVRSLSVSNGVLAILAHVESRDRLSESFIGKTGCEGFDAVGCGLHILNHNLRL